MVGELVETGRKQLQAAPFQPNPREAHLLLSHVLGLSEASILARWDEAVSSADERSYRALLERRLTGEPVAYLLGEREFYGRPFAVDRRVLIPRPETEHLIEAALALDPAPARVLDLGTGSGCLAVTLALELGDAAVVAVDRAAGALDVARANARSLGAGARVRFVCGDLAGATDLGDFDLVVSNPPYVGRHEVPDLSIEVTGFEPHEALFPADHPDAVIECLLAELDGLRPGAHLLVEIGHLQAPRRQRLLANTAFELVRTVPDYQGIPRVLVTRRR